MSTLAPRQAGLTGGSLWIATAALVGLAAGGIAVGISWQVPVALGLWALLVFYSVRDLRVALFGLLFTLPLDIYGRIVAEPVAITVFHLVLGAALIAWLARIVGDLKEWYRPSAVDAFGLAVVVAGVWSIPWSEDVSLTVIAIVRVVFLWAFASMYVNGVRTRDVLHQVFVVLVVIAALMASLGIAQQFVPGFSFGNVIHVHFGSSRAAGLFDDPNVYAAFLASILVAAAALVVHGVGKRPTRLLIAISGAVIGIGVMATYSRSAWLSTVVGMVAVIATAPKRRRRILVTAALVAVMALAMLAPASVIDRARSIADPEGDKSNWTRYAMYISTVEMIQDDWVFGTGLGAYHLVYPDYRLTGTHLSVIKPHQLPLALWAETGVVGLMSIVVFIAGLVMTLWRRRPDGWDGHEAASLAGLIVLLLGSMFQYHLYFEYLWLFFALVVVSARFARERTLATAGCERTD